MNSKAIPEEIIFNFCTKILPDFNIIMKNLEELHNDLSPSDFAIHLMELGRGQMSEVEDPSEKEVNFISDYVASLNQNKDEAFYFTAYAGGCVMGLVIDNVIPRDDLSRALYLIEQFAHDALDSSSIPGNKTD